MSTLQVATILSTTSSTPPVFQDSAGTQIGTLARAWVYFNATTGTPVIIASFNVSSITDNGVGDFTVNFTTAMPDANYCAISTADSGTSVSPRTSQTGPQTASGVTVYTQTFQGGVTAGARQDMNSVKVVVFD